MNAQNQLTTANHRDAHEVESATASHDASTCGGVNGLGIADQLTKILAALGDSADAVASRLRGAGIQGTLCTARFLNSIVRFARRQVTVDALSLDVMKPGTFRLICHDGTTAEAALPQAVQDFLHGFNEGTYPDLELPHGRT